MKVPISTGTACAAFLALSHVHADCAKTTRQTLPVQYPTEVIADYVLGCMLSNGSSADVLRKCACSLDFIAASISYEDYEKAETLLRLQQVPGGGRTAIFKSSNWATNAVAKLREVQAESTLRCF